VLFAKSVSRDAADGRTYSVPRWQAQFVRWTVLLTGVAVALVPIGLGVWLVLVRRVVFGGVFVLVSLGMGAALWWLAFRAQDRWLQRARITPEGLEVSLWLEPGGTLTLPLTEIQGLVYAVPSGPAPFSSLEPPIIGRGRPFPCQRARDGVPLPGTLGFCDSDDGVPLAQPPLTLAAGLRRPSHQ
jgi:hypothetical protein